MPLTRAQIEDIHKSLTRAVLALPDNPGDFRENLRESLDELEAASAFRSHPVGGESIPLTPIYIAQVADLVKDALAKSNAADLVQAKELAEKAKNRVGQALGISS